MTGANNRAGKREAENSATVVPEAMAWDSRARRAVLLYLRSPASSLFCCSPSTGWRSRRFKPNAELYDYKTYNPF